MGCLCLCRWRHRHAPAGASGAGDRSRLQHRDPAAPLVRPAPVPQRPRRPDLLGARPHHRAELYRRRLALLADRIPNALRRTRRADPAEFEDEAGTMAGAGELELGGGKN